MEASKPQIVEDPNIAAEQAAAQRSQVTNLQNEAQIDTASILARFGTTQALNAAGIAPRASVPAAGPAVRF